MSQTEVAEKWVTELGPGPLTEKAIAQHVKPLFTRVLSSPVTYMANHSLGRPPDQVEADLAEAWREWTTRLGQAWGPWLNEREAYRARLAQILGAEDRSNVVPRTSAAQGLRAVLNALPGKPRVLSTRGEFDSTDMTLKQYAAAGRIDMQWVEAQSHAPDGTPVFSVDPLLRAVTSNTTLVVVSQAFFSTGQLLEGIPDLAAKCRQAGALLLLDSYHAVGVVPVNVLQLGADIMIGASYKYLRGGPGAGFFYLSPRYLDRGYTQLDAGWFAKSDFFEFGRDEKPRLEPGGNGYIDATPPIFTWYQARAGQQFLLAMGVDRLRRYSLEQLQYLKARLAEYGVPAHGGDKQHGAFLVIRHPQATALNRMLLDRGFECDARGSSLRICPDCLTTRDELDQTAEGVGEVWSEFAAQDVGGLF